MAVVGLIRRGVKCIVFAGLVGVPAIGAGNQRQRDSERCQSKCNPSAHHILIKRLTPRTNAAIMAMTSSAKLPRITSSQMVERMLKNDGIFARAL